MDLVQVESAHILKVFFAEYDKHGTLSIHDASKLSYCSNPYFLELSWNRESRNTVTKSEWISKFWLPRPPQILKISTKSKDSNTHKRSKYVINKRL